MNDNITDKVLQQITDQQVKPKPRWEFLLKKSLLWTLFGLAIVIGSLAVGLMIFASHNNALYDFLQNSGQISAFISSAPYLWLILLVIFTAVAYYNFRHTDSGYRYNGYWIIGLSVVGSLIGGSMIYGVGLAETVEGTLYDHFRPYQNFENFRHQKLLRPDDGQLIGVFVDHQDLIVRILDPQRQIWEVTTGIGIAPAWWEALPPQAHPRVIVFGQVTGPGKFQADIIKPLMPLKINERKILPMRIER